MNIMGHTVAIGYALGRQEFPSILSQKFAI